MCNGDGNYIVIINSQVISKKTSAYQCREDPNSFGCSGLAQFSGDDANSTDVILSLDIEVDGQWGPYLYCNPLNSSNEDTGKKVFRHQ